jgi:uncharacterized protein (DUF58 family)
MLLDPELLGRLGSLELIARGLVEGFLVGLHRSPYHGFSVEFAEYRQYIPGESTHNIDWRVFAKTDRHYVKVFQEETNLMARVLLDVSASMSTPPAEKVHSKLQYAKLLAAALSYLLLKQNDAVGLVTFDERALEIIPPRSSRKQLMHLMARLQNAKSGKRTRVGKVLSDLADRVWRRGLVVIISDLIDDPVTVLRGLKHFRHRQHEVIVFHVLDPRELDLDYSRQARFVDPEGELDPLSAQPWHLQENYTARIAAWRKQLSRECGMHQIDYVPLTTKTPFDVALMAYLAKRARLG